MLEFRQGPKNPKWMKNINFDQGWINGKTWWQSSVTHFLEALQKIFIPGNQADISFERAF